MRAPLKQVLFFRYSQGKGNRRFKFYRVKYPRLVQ
jgi:hypothetical protein